jgi:hypothetical protein
MDFTFTTSEWVGIAVIIAIAVFLYYCRRFFIDLLDSANKKLSLSGKQVDAVVTEVKFHYISHREFIPGICRVDIFFRFEDVSGKVHHGRWRVRDRYLPGGKEEIKVGDIIKITYDPKSPSIHVPTKVLANELRNPHLPGNLT